MKSSVIAVVIMLAAATAGAQTTPPAAAAPAAPAQQAAPPALPSCPELAAAVQGRVAQRRRGCATGRTRAVPRREPHARRAGGRAKPRRLHGRLDHRRLAAAAVRRVLPGKPYVGRGISGQTTPQMLIRFRPDVVALRPKVVVILAGTNDIAGNTGPMTDEQIQGNLASMAELAKANGIRVVFSSILPVSEYHVRPGDTAPPQTTRRPMARITALNAWMKDYAAANGHVYLDYVAAMADAKGLLRADLSEDDLHPNAAGYAIMGPLAEAAIQAA